MEVSIKVQMLDSLTPDELNAFIVESARQNVSLESLVTRVLREKAQAFRDSVRDLSTRMTEIAA